MSPRNSTEVGQRRHYEWRGTRYPSVTTILKVWPMEWAIAYGAKHVAERALTPVGVQRIADWYWDHDGEPVEREDILRWLKKAPAERRDDAADAGTALHAYLEARLGGTPPQQAAAEDIPRDGERAIDAFLDAYRPEPLFVESQVFSVSDGWAGSCDAFVRIYGKVYALDLKTGIVSHKDRLQLAAYAHGDFIGEDDVVTAPVPYTDGALVLSVPRDDPRSWQLLEVAAGREEYNVFLAAKRLWQFYDATKAKDVGEILLMQTEGDAA